MSQQAQQAGRQVLVSRFLLKAQRKIFLIAFLARSLARFIIIISNIHPTTSSQISA